MTDTPPKKNPADNLSLADRHRGGLKSSSLQQRDEKGKFKGKIKPDSIPNPGSPTGDVVAGGW